ncbi:MAG: hypothetical protein ACXVCD_05945 [Pseudobdellovibrionaceae bacterium]
MGRGVGAGVGSTITTGVEIGVGAGVGAGVGVTITTGVEIGVGAGVGAGVGVTIATGVETGVGSGVGVGVGVGVGSVITTGVEIGVGAGVGVGVGSKTGVDPGIQPSALVAMLNNFALEFDGLNAFSFELLQAERHKDTIEPIKNLLGVINTFIGVFLHNKRCTQNQDQGHTPLLIRLSSLIC